jgi:hypothetical protein
VESNSALLAFLGVVKHFTRDVFVSQSSSSSSPPPSSLPAKATDPSPILNSARRFSLTIHNITASQSSMAATFHSLGLYHAMMVAFAIALLAMPTCTLAMKQPQSSSPAEPQQLDGLDCEDLGFGATLVCSTCDKLADALSPTDCMSIHSLINAI